MDILSQNNLFQKYCNGGKPTMKVSWDESGLEQVKYIVNRNEIRKTIQQDSTSQNFPHEKFNSSPSDKLEQIKSKSDHLTSAENNHKVDIYNKKTHIPESLKKIRDRVFHTVTQNIDIDPAALQKKTQLVDSEEIFALFIKNVQTPDNQALFIQLTYLRKNHTGYIFLQSNTHKHQGSAKKYDDFERFVTLGNHDLNEQLLLLKNKYYTN